MNNKFLHFSVDDVIDCFEDIFVNNYDSIFQNQFLLDWKTLHDADCHPKRPSVPCSAVSV